MATWSITECMVRIRNLPEKVADLTAKTMKKEIDSSTHGEGRPVHLSDTIKVEKMANGTYTVSTNKFVGGYGYAVREVGAIIRKGRPALEPKWGDFLRWHDEDGWHTAKHVRSAPANNFVERTIEEVEREVAAKGLSL